MENLLTKARKVFAQDRYASEATHVEIEQLELDEPHKGGHAVCKMTLRPEVMNARGAVMGGALFTLADLAFAAAANAHEMARGEDLAWVSLTSNIQFVSAATQGELRAEALCVKQGRTTCTYYIKVCDTNQRTIATVNTTGMRVQ